MAKAALVGAAPFNREHFCALDADIVVAVDGGWRSLERAGVLPDLALGDFDSLGYVPDFERVETFPPEKDESDLELACRRAVQLGASELVLYGCLGDRLDHTLASIQVMLAQARAGIRCWAIGPDFVLTVLYGEGPVNRVDFAAAPLASFAADGYANHLSVFALGGKAQGVSLSGLAYPLSGAELPDDVSRGLSNEFTGAAASIELSAGGLVVLFALPAWDYLACEGARPGEGQ